MRYQGDKGDREAKATIFLLAVLVILSVVTIRLLHLQVIQAERLKNISDNNRIRSEYVPALRGRILDKNGHVLADNIPSFCAVLDPLLPEYRRTPERLDTTIGALALLLGVDVNWLRAKVNAERYRAPLGIRFKNGLTDVEVAAIEEAAGRLPGVRVEARPQRCYPNAGVACHLLGTVGEVTEAEVGGGPDSDYKAGDFVGRTGVEKQYELHLRGRDGRRRTQVDALGRRVGLFGGLEKIPPEPGEDLRLTLDLELQEFVEDILAKFSRGTVVVLGMKSGGVLALASEPSFDPNMFSRGLSHEEWSSLEADEGHPLINRCTQATYPPGSTFKLLTAIAALEEGVIDPRDRPVNCVGYYVLGNRKFGCWKESGHGRLKMVEALEQSCGSYFFNLGKLLGVEGISSWAKRLGFDRPTGIDMPAERRNFVPDPQWYDEKYGRRGWTQGLALNLAIGQGELLATPLKLATLAMAIGGSGRWPVPRIAENAEVEWNTWDVPQSVLDVVREGMFEAVQGERGSGRHAAVEGIHVGGKTGTAQNPHGNDHSIFIGFAPWRNPSVAIAVYLENAGHGGQNAAPLAGGVLNFYFTRQSADAGVSGVGSFEGALGGGGYDSPVPAGGPR